MAKITRIKASDGPSRKEEADEPAITRKKVVVKDKKAEKNKRKEMRAKEKAVSENIGSDSKGVKSDVKKVDKTSGSDRGDSAKSGKKVFILFRPFVALGRYLKGAWHELRQVRWPNRKATWKMVLAVLVYTAIFVLFISLLDLFFSWLFNLILNK